MRDLNISRPSYEDRAEREEIYSSDYRSQMLEDDEISPWEEAFMEGYDNAVV